MERKQDILTIEERVVSYCVSGYDRFYLKPPPEPTISDVIANARPKPLRARERRRLKREREILARLNW